MADVFISYHTDSGLDTVREIAAALESAGVSCWYANRDIKGGDFAEQITCAIYECSVFLLLLNKQSNASWDVQNEVKLAYDRNKEEGKLHILPYRIADCRLTGGMLYRLTRFVIVDRKDEDIPDLVERIGKLLGREPAPPKPAQRAPAPSISLPAQPRIVTPKRRIYRPTIAAGNSFTVGLRTDGTVIGTGFSGWYRGVKSWRGMVAVTAGSWHTVGLKADGTVLATGDNNNGQCDVSQWSGVAAVAAGQNHTVGLKADGTVLATGDNNNGQCNVSQWADVVAVAAGGWHTIGLKADGTVLATGANGKGRCNVSGWSGVVEAAAGEWHTVGLKADGTVLATGWNEDGQRDVSQWSGVAAVAAGGWHTIGLKVGGTVLATGERTYGQCNVSKWSDVVAVAAGNEHTVGLKADGTVLATGNNDEGQCNVQNWHIRLPEWVEI